MRSLLLEAVGRLRLVDGPPPKQGESQTLLRVSHCAVCRTDAKMWREGHRDLTLPRVPGHEICGSDEAGGGRFVVWPGVSCGSCSNCLAGLENLCPTMSIQGFHRDGGFAEQVSVPSSSLIPVPTGLPGHLACFAEPLGCALNALEQIRLSAGASVLIFGGGSLGLLLTMAIREMGAEPFLVETNGRKLDRSKAFRANLEIDGSITCSRSEFDAAINATASPASFLEGIPRLRTGGCFCAFSGLSSGESVPSRMINEIHYRQLHLVGAYGCTRAQMARALDLIQHRVDAMGLLIEDRIGLEQVPSVFPAVLSGQALKFVVDFQPEGAA